MSARTKARKRALDILFEAEQRGTNAHSVYLRVANEATSALNPYTEELVLGVTAHGSRIDELLGTYSEGWTLDRMPAVDRNMLRIAVYELLYEDIPANVVIDEAVGLVGSLSTDESPAFVNGLLGRIASMRERLSATPE